MLQTLAASDKNSDLRFNSRKLLPGMAKRLRDVWHPPLFGKLLDINKAADCSQHAPSLSSSILHDAQHHHRSGRMLTFCTHS